MSPRRINVLIVDDSAFIRKAMKRMLGSDTAIKVIGEARDGYEAIQMVKGLNPDVVTLDVKMPDMDGLQALERIMREHPVPVLMVSSLTSEGGAVTLKALEMGAVDFIDKSSCHTAMDIADIASSLIQKVKVIAGVDMKKVVESTPEPRPVSPATLSALSVTRDENPALLVAIGTSTGGPMSLEKVLTPLPANFPGTILVVQHMPLGFTSSLAQRMNNQCPMEVKEAEEDDPLCPGRIYIAPSGYHLKLRRSLNRYHVVLSKEPRDMPHCPSVDVMMESIAQTWQGRMMGVVMTGMGHDGSDGIKAMKQQGGTIVAQNEETCVVYGMPRAAYLTGCVDRMLPLYEIANAICLFAR